jgi:hypothetical protein
LSKTTTRKKQKKKMVVLGAISGFHGDVHGDGFQADKPTTTLTVATEGAALKRLLIAAGLQGATHHKTTIFMS